MTKKILIAPSILSCDFSKLELEVKKVESSGADLIHIDVMDGCFVPNVTIGPVVVKAIRKVTKLPLDVHLMIEEPHNLIKPFIDAGSDIVTIHAEAYPMKSGSGKTPITQKGVSKTVDKIDEAKVKEVLGQIRSYGKKSGISLNPNSPFCLKGVLKETDMILIMSVHPGFGGQEFIKDVIPKMKEARKLYSGDIEVDGGINDKNVASVVAAGANVIVAGSYFFRSKDPKEAVKKLRI